MIPYLLIIAAAMFLAMAAGHWWPALDGEGRNRNLIRYMWGTGWIGAGMTGFYLAAHPTGLQMLIAFWLFLVACGSGTALGHLYDWICVLRVKAERHDNG